MKPIIGLAGGLIGAIIGAYFLAQAGAVWYTGESEFQSPDEFEETYSLVYFSVIAGAALTGYLIARIAAGKLIR
ncbi:MAG: hypothetical protein AAGJ70_11945 [Pseudomonadota bacterium]